MKLESWFWKTSLNFWGVSPWNSNCCATCWSCWTAARTSSPVWGPADPAHPVADTDHSVAGRRAADFERCPPQRFQAKRGPDEEHCARRGHQKCGSLPRCHVVVIEHCIVCVSEFYLWAFVGDYVINTWNVRRFAKFTWYLCITYQVTIKNKVETTFSVDMLNFDTESLEMNRIYR